MKQPRDFVVKRKVHMVLKFKRFIYGLQPASRSWNQYFDQVVKSYEFEQCPDKNYVYKKCD